MEDNGARCYVGYLAKAVTVKIFKANGCALADKSCEMMLKAQKENKKLKLREIHVKNNDIGDAGMKQLGQFCSGMKSLEYIDISTNKCTKNGLNDFVKELVKCKQTLRYVNISNNKGGDLAVASIIDLVDKCSVLKELHLSGIGISKDNAKKLADGLVKCWQKSWNLNSSLRKIVW